MTTKRGSAAEFEEWLGREDCPVHWDESAEKNAKYGWEAALVYASAQPRWIAVSERLPGMGESEVRVLLRDGSQLNNAILQSDGDWWWDERFFDESQVTHWMSLPDALEGDQS